MQPGDNGDEAIVFAQICHILGASDDGPRAVPGLSAKERNSPENLILLCPNHHATVDKRPDAFPPEKLRIWKDRQERPERALVEDYLTELHARLERRLADHLIFAPRSDATPVEMSISKRPGGSSETSGLKEISGALPTGLSIIVGQSGAGKSNLAIRLALNACDLNDTDPREVPILTDLSQYQGSFRSTVERSAVDLTGIPIELRQASAKSTRLLVLCDDFHACSTNGLSFSRLAIGWPPMGTAELFSFLTIFSLSTHCSQVAYRFSIFMHFPISRCSESSEGSWMIQMPLHSMTSFPHVVILELSEPPFWPSYWLPPSLRPRPSPNPL